MKLTNKKNIIGFIIGGIVFGGIGVFAANQILATQVSYTNTKSTKSVTNVDAALNELYDLALDCINNASSGSDVTYKGSAAVAIYLNPTNLSATCTTAASSETGTKNGCMRFYVYAEDSEYKYAILDHNTTATVNGFYAAQSQVKQDTASWDPNLQARNIRTDEVYKITESTNNYISNHGANWQINDGHSFYFNQKNGSNGEGYGWLFDRAGLCNSYGCTTEDNNYYNENQIWGYWTSDAAGSSGAWKVDYRGTLSYAVFSVSIHGVRPVIQIKK